MSKQLLRSLPLIALELPYLTRGKDSNDAGPILGLKLLRCINNNESNGVSSIY